MYVCIYVYNIYIYIYIYVCVYIYMCVRGIVAVTVSCRRLSRYSSL